MKKSYFIYGLFYLFIAAILFPFVRWYADNPDTFQYLAIAQKYSSADWSHAINGYWSPMISWLLIIPISIFSNELIAFKILQLIIGLYTLLQLIKLLEKTDLIYRVKQILLFAFIIFIVDYALLNASPDLLFMGLIVTLLNLAIGDFLFSLKTALLTGVVGALLYLTKAFGFPFFIVVTLLLILLRNYKSGIRRIVKNALVMFVVFLFICLGWIIPLSIHYGHFTISEAAAFNQSRDIAPLPNRSEELTILGSGLFSPREHSFSAWESPGDYVSKEKVTLFNSPSDYYKIVKRNILSIYYFDFRNQIGIVFIVLLIVALLFRKKEVTGNKILITILLFTFLIYSGYSLILFHQRYAWVNTILMLIASLYLIQIVFSDTKKIILVSLSFLIILLAVKRPAKEILFTQDKQISAHWIFRSIRHPFNTMWIFYRPDRLLERSIEDLRQRKILSGNIASLKIRNTERYPYTSALRISQSLKLPYYGQVDDKLRYHQQEEQLKKMKIDFLITWNNSTWGSKPPVYVNAESGLKIFSIK